MIHFSEIRNQRRQLMLFLQGDELLHRGTCATVVSVANRLLRAQEVAVEQDIRRELGISCCLGSRPLAAAVRARVASEGVFNGS